MMDHQKVLESCLGSMCCALSKRAADFQDAERVSEIGSAVMATKVQWASMNTQGFLSQCSGCKEIRICRHPRFSLLPDLVGKHEMRTR